MKTLLITMILILTTANLFSQNRIDPERVLIKKTDTPADTIFISSDTTFVKGFNWASQGARLDSAMGINYYHNVNLDPDSIDYYRNARLMQVLAHPERVIVGGRNCNRSFQAHSLYLNPTITVDSTSNFKPKPYDNTGAVFGFQHKSKVLLLDSTAHSDPNYSFALLRKDSLITGQSHVVLKNAWKGDIIRYLNYHKDDNWFESPQTDDSINTKRMFLTINLKSLEPIPLNLRDSTILSIKVPYTFKYLKDTIIRRMPEKPDTTIKVYTTRIDSLRFHSFHVATQNIQNDTMRLLGSRGDFRGIVRRTDTTGTSLNQTEWRITGAMLDAYGNGTSDSCVTISAFFKCDESKYLNGTYINNPLLEPDNYIHPTIIEYITNLDVEVKYHKPGLGISVGLNYLRFETPRAQEIFRGQWDTVIQNAATHTLNRIRNHPRKPKLYRFYTDDEMLPAQWATNRYLNMLLDTLAALESFAHEADMPLQYLYATGFKEIWNGTNIRYNAYTAAPYIKYGIFRSGNRRSPTVFNYQFGYAGFLGSVEREINNEKVFVDTLYEFQNTLNSHYETFLSGFSDSIPITDPTPYEYIWPHPNTNYAFGALFNVETFMYLGYYKNQDMLYNNKNWWANLWISSGAWGFNSTLMTYTLLEEHGRPRTGEEIRLQTTLPVLLGAKGLIYWLKSTEVTPASNNMALGLQPAIRNYGNLTGDALLRSDNLGGDYVNVTNDPHRFDDFYNPLAYNWDLMNITEDRIYIGLTSTRTQVANLNRWIEHNNNLLMSLKLQAWYGKGFLTWNSQAPGLPSNVMDSYIDIGQTKVRRLYEQEFENIDSAFFDIALHRVNGKTLDEEQYWAVQSRRTDPLIHVTDTINWISEDQYEWGTNYYETLRFYSTAELENYCDNGGPVVNPDPAFPHIFDLQKDTLYWREKYWRRQGSRELNIATKVIDGTKNIYYRVEEITDGTEFDEDLPWWKQEEIRNRIDRIIPQGESLSIKLLPGQGKLMKVTFIETPNLFGELAFSNQTKIIAYPVNQTSNYDFEKVNDTLNFYKDDSMYYHIVYDRKQPSDLYRVYYRRSVVPYNRSINTKIIQWGPEILLSDTIVFTKALHLPQLPVDSIYRVTGNNLSCKNPSIVVRYDEVDSIAKAYVVFGCSMPDLGSHPDEPKVFIVESVFRHNQFFPTLKGPNRLKPIVVSNVHSTNPDQLDVWAAPNINASFSGNYITWSDSIFGIGVGFKVPNDKGFVFNKKFIKYDPSGKCNQPSLNTYSRLNINEDNCALVFKEISQNWTNIIYTQLHNPNGQIDNYIPLNHCDPGNLLHRIGIYSFDMKSIMINKNYGGQTYANAEYPAVYRPVDFARRPGFEVADSLHYVGAIWDRVYWQSTLSTDPQSPMGISLKNIDIDLNQDCWYLLPALRLYNPSFSIAQPSPGPGAPSSNKSGTFSQFALADSSFLLNFIKYPFLGSPNGYSDVYQINFNAWLNYFSRWTGAPGGGIVNIEWWASVGQGMYPHTTHTPVITENRDWYIHNRIYQAENNAIRTSAILFLKGAQDQKTIYPLLSLSDENSKSQISEIFTLGNSIEDRYTSIGLKAFSKDENGKLKRVDTIVSNWFRIDAIKELAFYSILSDTTLFSFELEDKNGKSLKMPLNSDRNNSLNGRKITFLNGKNKEYRIKLTKKSKDVSVWLDLLFDDKRDLSEEVSDYSSKELRKSNVEFEPKHQVYDLSDHEITSGEMMNLNTYPNPAGDYIYVSCELLTNTEKNSPVKYTLFNSTGSKVFESTSKESITIIHTDELPSGVYFLKAEQLEFDLNSEVKPFVTKTVIIQR